MDRRIQHYKDVSSKLTLTQCNLKIPTKLFMELEKLMLKFTWKKHVGMLGKG